MAFNDQYVWSPWLGRRILIDSPDWKAHCALANAALLTAEADPASGISQYFYAATRRGPEGAGRAGIRAPARQ